MRKRESENGGRGKKKYILSENMYSVIDIRYNSFVYTYLTRFSLSEKLLFIADTTDYLA